MLAWLTLGRRRRTYHRRSSRRRSHGRAHRLGGVGSEELSTPIPRTLLGPQPTEALRAHGHVTHPNACRVTRVSHALARLTGGGTEQTVNERMRGDVSGQSTACSRCGCRRPNHACGRCGQRFNAAAASKEGLRHTPATELPGAADGRSRSDDADRAARYPHVATAGTSLSSRRPCQPLHGGCREDHVR
jgi:hypothetical protein